MALWGFGAKCLTGWNGWTGYPLDCYDYKSTCRAKKGSRLQREAGSEPDFVIIMKNNLQDPKTSNASASAGKYLIYGEGAIREKLLQSGIQFFLTTCPIRLCISEPNGMLGAFYL